MTDNRPRPAPPPGRRAAPRAQATGEKPAPLASSEFLRLQALRAAIDAHRTRHTAGDAAILATAERFAAYILTGKTETEGH